MAVFAIYSYKFRDVDNIGMFVGQEEDIKPLPTTQEKQVYLQQIFREDIDGVRPFECFLMESQISKDSNLPIKQRLTYGCKVVWEKAGLILLMVSNPYKTVTRHENFKKLKEKDDPWCHVLIDNRPDREFIAIQKNSSFISPDIVAQILQSSLRARFSPHHATIDIKNSYEPDAFWDTIDKYQLLGIQEIVFRFAAPNPAWQAALLGGISDAAKSMNARPTTTFSAHDGTPLLLSKNNTELCKFVDVCAISGEDIIVKVKKIRARIHIKDVKNKYIFKEMSEETFREILKGEPDLYDESFDSFAEFLNQIVIANPPQKEDE